MASSSVSCRTGTEPAMRSSRCSGPMPPMGGMPGLSARRHGLSHRLHALHPILHARLAVAHALAERARCSGVSTRATSSIAWVMRRLIWSCCCSICWRICSTAAASTVGAVNDLHAALAQAAAGFGLRLQVGGGGGGDLLDLAALRIAGVQAVEHAVDHAAHALGRAAEHHAAAHAAVHAVPAVVTHPAPAVLLAHRAVTAVAHRRAAPVAPMRPGSSAASSVISMPIITSLTRRDAFADAALATAALLISLLLRPTVGDGDDGGGAA